MFVTDTYFFIGWSSRGWSSRNESDRRERDRSGSGRKERDWKERDKLLQVRKHPHVGQLKYRITVQ